MSHKAFLKMLPSECQHIEIQPRHKIALEPIFNKEGVQVVLLTDMPGDSDKYWSLTWDEWRDVDPKHETKLRWIREHLEPKHTGTRNPPRYRQLLLF